MSTTTDRRYVSQLGHNEQINQVFLASDKQLRPNRNGNLYLQLQLSDRSGGIAARLWNASENDYRAFENGDYVKVDGNTQLFQGNMQLIASAIRRARQRVSRLFAGYAVGSDGGRLAQRPRPGPAVLLERGGPAPGRRRRGLRVPHPGRQLRFVDAGATLG